MKRHVEVRWYVVSWAGGHPPWALSLLVLVGGVRMAIRSMHVTSVALEICRIDVLFVGSSVCHFGAGYFV